MCSMSTWHVFTLQVQVQSPKLILIAFSVPTSSKLDTCEVTGFETRVREECEDVSEIECRPIQVKKVRTEIRQQCDVKLNKTCDVVFNPAPKDLCSLVMEKR